MNDLEQARQLSRRFGFREIEGAALHDLCVIHLEQGQGSIGFNLAREAIAVYEPGSTGIAKIAHDVAVFMMQSRGDFANALTVFRELENHTFGPADKLLLWGNIARAAASAGEMLVFEHAWEEAGRLIERTGEGHEHLAAAMINLAHGALAAGRIEWAEAVACRAKEIAASRHEDALLPFAEDLLRSAAYARQTRTRPRTLRDPSHDVKDAGRLARQLVSTLRARGSRKDDHARLPSRTRP